MGGIRVSGIFLCKKDKWIIKYMRKRIGKNNEYAPIVVFAYNRADKLESLLQSLERNPNTKKMELYIFVDVPDRKNRKDIDYNQEVIKFLKEYSVTSVSFKSIKIEVANKHKGLADSIISGVSQVIQKYGKIIVLEDDLEVSNDFLDYMQRGLCFYKSDNRVWSLAGHCPEMKFLHSYEKDIFLLPRAESLGWGTWVDRWNKTDWDVSSYRKFKRNLVDRFLFNVGGNDLGLMLDCQMQDDKLDSWAIRWCYQQFVERKYTVFPRESRVIHCGNDSRGTHGVYYSTQKLRENYKRCHFEHVNPDIKLIWKFKKLFDIH